MNSYMVDIDLPEEFTPEFMNMIPSQRAYITKMMKKGNIANYSLSFDRQKLWVVVNAESSFEARQIISAFPIFNFIRFDIHNLLFHDTSSITTRQMWLN